MAINKNSIKNAMRVWNMVRGITTDELLVMQAKPLKIAVFGEPEHCAQVVQKLNAESGIVREYNSHSEAIAQNETHLINADLPELLSDTVWKEILISLVQIDPDLRIALGAKIHAFRPIVSEILTNEWSAKNARFAAISALPGVVPLFGWLTPMTSAGDILILTRNQMSLLLEIAAAHNLPPDPRGRLTELIPIVGSAFGWRALAREAVGLVPGGIGLALKSGIAYAGTYTVGKAAAFYYQSGGKSLNVTKLFRETVIDAVRNAKLRIDQTTTKLLK